MGYLVEFDKILWNKPAVGVQSKAFINDNQQLRIVEFSEGFIEPDWCIKGHAGYVLNGSFSIDYDGLLENYKTGDVIFIPKGEKSKHKALVGKNQKVTLLLFEIIE